MYMYMYYCMDTYIYLHTYVPNLPTYLPTHVVPTHLPIHLPTPITTPPPFPIFLYCISISSIQLSTIARSKTCVWI